MLEAFLAAVVGALTGRAAEGIAEAADSAWSALLGLVKRKLGADPGAATALAAVQQSPQDEDRQAALLVALRRAVAEDARFAADVRSLWQQAQVEIRAEQGGVANVLSGTAHTSVQGGRDVTVNYWSAPDQRPVVPHQVPAAVATFVNRDAELSLLDRVFTGSPAPRIGMLVGMPGSGKTALARQWANATRHHGRFPGGELHVDFTELRGHTQTSGAVSEAVASCLRGLGVDERFMPVSLADLTNLYRTRTAERALLVVLDGVSEPAQVRALVPNAPGSAVMVATEYAMGELIRDGAQMIPVSPLSEQAAVALLASRCGAARIAAEPEAARSVARLCGGLPEALQVAAARLVLDPTISVGDLAGELVEEARRLDALALPGWVPTGVDQSIVAPFAFSYGRLPAPAQRLYRDLGAMPLLEIPLDLVLGLPDQDRASTRSALETLVSASLLERTRPDRYQLHQLVRLHAARLAAIERDGRDERILDGVVHHYLSRAGWADRAVMGERLRVSAYDPAASGAANPWRGPDRKASALAWLEAERANLLAVLRATVDAGQDEAAWPLAEALTALYFNHRHHSDWIEAARLGVRAAQRHGRSDMEARLRSVVSRAFTDLGDLRRARTEIEAAVRAIARIDDRRLVASVWEFYGRYLEHVDRREAIDAYRTAIDINTGAREWRGVALVQYFLGCCLDSMGRTDEAMPVLERARAALSELGDERMAARCTMSIGLAHVHAGDLVAAERALRAAADTFAAGQLWHYEVPAQEALAELAARMGDAVTAQACLRRALHLEEAAGGAQGPRLRAALAASA